MTGLVFARETRLGVADYISVVGDSALGESRPLRDAQRIDAMLAGSSLVVTARLDGACVGVARCLTDFAWVCYCADLAVQAGFQRRGLGTGLLRKVKQLLGDGVSITLLSAPGAVSYYEKIAPEIGMQRSHDAFYLPRSRGA